jgi:hypothetical protein
MILGDFYVLCVAFFLISILADFVFTNEVSGIVLSDLFNILWWTIFVFFLNNQINSIDDLNIFLRRVFKLSFLFGLLISAIGMMKLTLIMRGQLFDNFYTNDGEKILIPGTALNTDYNIYAMSLILACLAGKYWYDSNRNRFTKTLIFLGQIFMLVVVLFSNSRRGMILVLVTMLILLFTGGKSVYHSINSGLKKLCLLFGFIVLFMTIFQSDIDIVISDNNTAEIIKRMETLKTDQVKDDREERLGYAWSIIQETSIPNLVFGNGFGFLNSYALHFGNKNGSDHPHNFIVSTFLYGGIFSLVILVFFLIRLHLFYWYNFNEYYIFSYWFFIVLFISLTSTLTLFSVKLMVFLSVFPSIKLVRDRLMKINRIL